MGKQEVGQFLLRRLKEVGVNDIFGVPGDFALGFFDKIIKSDINYIGTCNELNAAYAADGYSRINGIGALCTTYSVGDLSAVNGVAGAWAEHVPVILISGWPTTSSIASKQLLHHTLGDYDIPKKIFEHITVAAVVIDNPKTAVELIDKALSNCLIYQKPVYIGICSDIVSCEIDTPSAPLPKPSLKISDPVALEDAVNATLLRLNNAKSPVFIPGVALIKKSLQGMFTSLLTKSGLPYATMMLAKTVITEQHPQHLGLYVGHKSRQYVREYVETSECVVILGERFTDFNTGGFSAKIPNENTIMVDLDKVTIAGHTYQNVFIHDFISMLCDRIPKRDFEIKAAQHNCVHRASMEYNSKIGAKLTMNRFFDRIAKFIPENAIVIAETGSSLFSIMEVLMPNGVTLIAQTFHGSIGYTIGACLGTSIAAKNRPVLLFIGDGSFQVTCQDLSTMIRYGCKPVVFLINNDGYTIERVIHDNIYNDIMMWKYSELPAVFGESKSFKCFTEDEVDSALKKCTFNDSLVFLELIMDKMDCNEVLRELGGSVAERNKID